MKEVVTAASLSDAVRQARCAGRSVGLVPTMGYLHVGHLRLAARARAENDLVVMSVFVNPTQFGPNEDFERYPRDLERDRRLAAAAGVDLLFTPDLETIYPGGPEAQAVWVEPGPLAEHLCGASRPGHFRGVATVVAKLLNLVQPDRAYFGQKDAQQAIILTRMARDLAFPVEVRVVETVREPDGLALSSRNVYLSAAERAQAIVLHRALQLARSMVEAGERDAQVLEGGMRRCIAEAAPLARIDYVTVADLQTLRPVRGALTGDALIALAVYFGPTRLIDNEVVSLSSPVSSTRPQGR
ncbi:MAG: pantoate--beta-alanine ligase [Chloroflexi bacterium]|nr:pantoate--beta-alanine ligase [Chloroflexota bacterium]